MNREPHSKYEHGVVKWELRVTWSDGEVEVMSASLHDSLRSEIEQHIVAQFDEEETYRACFPALEQLAMLKGYIVTESLNYEESNTNTEEQS